MVDWGGQVLCSNPTPTAHQQAPCLLPAPVFSSVNWDMVTLTLREEGILCKLQQKVLGCFRHSWGEGGGTKGSVGQKAGPSAKGR